MLALLWWLSPSAVGAGYVLPIHRGCFPWHGLEEQEPCGTAAPYLGTPQWDEGDEEEEGAACRASPRDGIYAEAVALWLGRAATGVPPRRRASLNLPAYCAGCAAGNGRWQRPTDPSRAAWGTEGKLCWMGSLVPPRIAQKT